MPKLGSQLLEFVLSGLLENKYPNLKWYGTDGPECTFSLEHLHKRNKRYSDSHFQIYKDYFFLKKPGCPIVNWTKVKSMLDSALNRKKNKYINLLGREGKKYIYEIVSYNSSPSGSSSSSPPPSSPSSSSFEESANFSEFTDSEMELKVDDSISNTLFHGIEDDMNALNMSLEMFDESYFNLCADALDATACKAEPLEKCMPCTETTHENSFGDSSINLETSNLMNYERKSDLMNSAGNPNLPNFALENEASVNISHLLQETNVSGSGEVNTAIADNVLLQNVELQSVPPQAFELMPTDQQPLKYCKRSLEVGKIGNDYTVIFKCVSNFLPVDDPVFLYLSKVCSPA